MTQNYPARRFKPRLLTKIVAASGTPEALGANTVRMAGLTFYAQNALSTPNAGNVTIQLDGVDAIVLEPDDVWTWTAPTYEAGYYLASDWTIKVATNGDGVRVLYSELQ